MSIDFGVTDVSVSYLDSAGISQNPHFLHIQQEALHNNIHEAQKNAFETGF